MTVVPTAPKQLASWQPWQLMLAAFGAGVAFVCGMCALLGTTAWLLVRWLQS